MRPEPTARKMRVNLHLYSRRKGIHSDWLQHVNVVRNTGGRDLQVAELRPPIAQDRSDLILLLLYAPGYTGETFEPVKGKQRLFYELFLLGKEAGLEGFEGFYKLDSFITGGGHALEAESDLKFLIGERIVEETKLGFTVLTDHRESVRAKAKKIPNDILQRISRVKARYNPIPQTTLFYYVFYKFLESKPTAVETTAIL